MGLTRCFELLTLRLNLWHPGVGMLLQFRHGHGHDRLKEDAGKPPGSA